MTLENLKISLRTDTLQNWTSIDPVLENGEMAIIKEDGDAFVRFKVGNGLSSFSQLPYINQHKLITDLVDTTKLDAQCISQGLNVNVSQLAFAAGIYLSAGSNFSQTLGINAHSKTADNYAFTWNGDDSRAIGDYYESHGKGTFNINPIDGISGLYIGNERFSDILQNKADVSAVGSKVIVDGVKTDLSIAHLSKQEYDELVGQDAVQSNVLYIVSGDYVDVIEDSAGNKISANLCCINEDGAVSKLVTFNDISSKADVASLSNYLLLSAVGSAVSAKADLSALDGYLPLSGGQMSGDIDMGGSYEQDEDSNFLKFIDRYLGNGIMGAGFGVYKADGEGGLEAQYVLEGVQLSDDGSEFDVMRRMDIVPLAGRLSEAESQISGKADISALSGYLPLSGGSMSGDVTLGKDNQIVFGSNSAGTVVFGDPSEADFGIYLSAEEDGEPAYYSKYVFSDTYSGFNVVEPIEEDVAVIRSGDLYAALSSKAELNDIPSQVSQLENDAGYTTNAGTITGITMNGTSKGTSGVVNLGTVLTAHQSLSNYYQKSETSSAAQINTALGNYYKKTETSSANEISTALENAGGGKVYFDNRISGVTGSNDLSVVKLSADEYAQMLEDGTCLSNAIYIVEAPNIDAFKQRITNVAPPTDLSDAATKEYVDNAVGAGGSGQLSTKLDSSAAWPAWVNDNIYEYKQIVSHNGKLWQAGVPGPVSEPGSPQAVDWLSVDINSVLTSQYQPKGNYLTAVPTTYKTYSQTVATLSNDGYATSTQVNQKSAVSFNRITTSGTNIGSITIDGTTTQIYAPASGGSGGGSSVQVSADYQTGTKVATISVDSVPTSIYIPNSGGSSRYALETAQLVSDGGSLTCAVNDQAITTIQVSSSATPIVVQLPTQPEDGARDFILRIEISSSAAPTFTFNGVNETIDFDSEDTDWAVMEPGLNLVSFTETKRGN